MCHIVWKFVTGSEDLDAGDWRRVALHGLPAGVVHWHHGSESPRMGHHRVWRLLADTERCGVM